MADIVNQAALDSNIYNPPVDQTSLMLYQIMLDSTNPTDEAALIQTYIDNFNALPRVNQFAGVIVNPSTCNINDITNALSDLNITGNQMVAEFPLTSTAWQAYIPELTSDNTTISNNLAIVADHTDALISNLPSLTGLAQAGLALDTVMNLLSNPCLGLSNFFGSLMTKGQGLLRAANTQINNAITAIKNKIASWRNDASSLLSQVTTLINDVKNMINSAKDAISQMVNQITAEVLHFAKTMLAQVRQGLAELMSHLPKDPCLASLISSVAPAAAAAIL